MKTLTQAIKNKAHHLGFSLVGVTTPDPPPHIDFYRAWIESGHNASMGWMSTERAMQARANPRAILPECQSILMLGMPYPANIEGALHSAFECIAPAECGTSAKCVAPDDSEGKISSYASNQDYHTIIPAKLKQLVQFIEEQTGESIPNRWYTDTGPVLERELAARAGLGWIGKNTCLINPQGGSYFFLAEIFLGLALTPDQPLSASQCGTCTRCIDSCPTGSLLEPYTLDANRCIAYLTIELKDAIPRELRPLMGDWIFGCDICQQVCPWNERFSSEREIVPELEFRADVANPILEDELTLSPQEFNRKFKGSPIKRTKRRGYLRNIAVALGNKGSVESIPALKSALGDIEPLVRGHAAWALGQIGGEDALHALELALDGEEDEEVREEILAALERSPERFH